MPSLAQIVNDWIKRDPLLKKHVKLDLEEQFPDEGVYVGCCFTASKNMKISYAIGYIGGNNSEYPTTTWDWSFDAGSALHVNNVVHHPGDPQFFEKLKAGLISSHNSLAHRTKCKINVRRNRRSSRS